MTLKRKVSEAVESSGMARLSGLAARASSRPISGRTAFSVMKAYVEKSNNTTAECYLSQDALALASGVGVRNVRVAQDWLIEHGWLIVMAKAVPNKRGLHVRLAVGAIPSGDASP